MSSMVAIDRAMGPSPAVDGATTAMRTATPPNPIHACRADP